MASVVRRTRRRVVWLMVMPALCIVIFACTPQKAARNKRPPQQASRGTASEAGQSWFEAACSLSPRTLRLIQRGTMLDRSADIFFIPRRPHFVGSFEATSHSGPDHYLQRVPLVFYGPRFVPANGAIRLKREVTLADIAPTIADLIGAPFPKDRAGKIIRGAVSPQGRREGKPALVMVVVWDGGGLNVLNQWPDAWPHLKKLVRNGTSVTNATAGSSPSVTPAVHATIGTGTFPEDHGMVDSYLRDGGEVVDAWEGLSPDLLEESTLVDLYDRWAGNDPVVGLVAEHPWHFGMVGHGARFPGGDRDIAMAITGRGETTTNRTAYSLPGSAVGVPGLDNAIRAVDAGDGALDSKWMGHELEGIAKGTPAWTIHQTNIIEQVIGHEGFGGDEVPDLFFTNYKELDLIGHKYNMVNPEVRSALEYTDAELPKLVALLNRVVGRGRWVMVLTADHGQQPDAVTLDAWPIGSQEMAADLAHHFAMAKGDLVEQTRMTGFWLDREELRAAGGDLEEVADFMLNYNIGQNAAAEIPAAYEGRSEETLIRAAFPASRVRDVLHCANGR